MSELTAEEKIDEISIYDSQLHTHIALSPDGKQFATFNKDNYEIKICDVEQISELNSIKPLNHHISIIKEIDLCQDTLGWSITISNKFKRIDESYDTLIAISCFGRDSINDVTAVVDNAHLDVVGDRDLEKTNKPSFGSTKIISIENNLYSVPLHAQLNSGIVKFMNDTHSNETILHLTLINSLSLYKFGIEIDTNQWLTDEYQLPGALKGQLAQLQNEQQRMDVLSRSIENDHFFVEDFRNHNRTIEIYDLKTSKILRTFQENITKISFHDTPVYTFSQNKRLFAFSHGRNKIKIHLMENGLEVSSKLLGDTRRIIFMEFVHNDEKLLIATQESRDTKTVRVDFKQVIHVWDLFSTSSNSFRSCEDNNDIFPHKNHYQLRLSSASGKILSIGRDGKVVSILDHLDIKNLVETRPLPIFSHLAQINIKNVNYSKYHTVFGVNGEELNMEDHEQEILINNNTEPWIIQNTYHRISAFLDEDKKIQLDIGQSTVQVWYICNSNSNNLNSKTKKSFLEFIWASHTHTPIEIESLAVGDRAFLLELSNPKLTLALPCHSGQVTIIKDACNALVHLYNQRGKYMKLSRQCKYDHLLHQTHSIIRRFINHYPSIWRLMDIRYNLMESLIKAREIALVNKVLSFKKHGYYLHTPRKLDWSKETKTTDLEVAIETSVQDNRGGLMVGFLLEYYSNNAKDNVEWMSTVARAIPKLYEAKLDIYTKELLYQPCFGSIEIHKTGVKIPNSYHVKGFSLPNKLTKQTEENTTLNEKLISFIQIIMSLIKTLKNVKTDKGICGSVSVAKKDDQIVALRVVPLPNFTYQKEIDQRNNFNIFNINILKLLKIIFWPRGYKFTKANLDDFSPFLQLILTSSDYIFDNPAMEAVIDFKWNQARNHFIHTSCGLYISYAICFGILSWAYISHLSTHILMILIIILFYFLAYHLLGIELQQLYHHGFQRYLSIYNLFDLMASIIPLAIVSIFLYDSFEFQNGFANTVSNKSIVNAIAFTVIILWAEFVLLLRLSSFSANYIYIFLNIMRAVFPFLLLMLIVMISFAHAIFIILVYPNSINLKPIVDTYSYMDPNTNKLTTITADYDMTDPKDNPFTSFSSSIEAAYFWLSGSFPQKDKWDLTSIDIITIMASFLLAIVMQNMLISLMGNVFNDASNAARLALLKWRAELIYEYEVIEKAFKSNDDDPTFIYYTGQSRIFEQWEEKSKEQRKGFKSLESIEELMNKDDVDDDDDANGFPDEARVERFWYCHCNVNSLEEEEEESKKGGDTTVKENEQISLLQNQVNTLNDKLTSVESNLNVLLELLKKQTV